MDDESDVFSVDMFHERYHRIEFNPLSAESVEEDLTNGFVTDLDAEEETISDTDIGDDPDDLHNLSDTEKFKHVMPILLKIGNLISKHSTNDFYGYIEDLEDLEKAIRRRQRYRISSSMSAAEEEENLAHPPSSSTTDTCTSPGPSSSNLTSQPSNTEVYLEHDSSQSSDPNRFHNITFKENLKRKGRPKKANKQVSFRKTRHDQPGKARERKVTNKRKKKSNANSNAFKDMVAEHRGGPSSDFLDPERQDCEPSVLNLPNQIENMNIPASIGSLGDVSAPFISHLISDEPSYFDL